MPTEPPPETAAAALARAGLHARRAIAEATRAAAALVDAVSIAAAGRGAPAPGSPISARLVQLAGWLDAQDGDPGAVLDALHAALADEIARWERLGRDDPDARAVLRAFLAVRELLFELGVRGGAGAASDRAERTPPGGAADAARRRTRKATGASRVRRLRVEG